MSSTLVRKRHKSHDSCAVTGLSLFTCGRHGNRSHLSLALHDLDPFPPVLVGPFRPVALIDPFIGGRHFGNHQLKLSIPPGDQSDASVGVAPGVLRPRHHVSLGPKYQNVLRRRAPLHRPGDGQVGGVGELPGDVAGEREFTSFWDHWGRGHGGDPEGVGDD